MSKLSKRTQVIIFVALTYSVSWLIQAYEIKAGHNQNSIYGLLLMWAPGIIALWLSFLFGQRARDLALAEPPLRPFVIGYAVPAFCSIVSVVLLILFRISDFEISQAAIAKKGSLLAVLTTALVVAPSIGMVFPFVSAIGEEIGWRGFLHTKLINLTHTRRYLLTGLIWSVWHWPLILFGTYATSEKPWLSVLIFTVVQTAFSFLLGTLRDYSRSVFPAAVAHASHNMWFLGITPAFYSQNALTPYFAGESGLFCALLYVGIALIIGSRRLAVR